MLTLFSVSSCVSILLLVPLIHRSHYIKMKRDLQVWLMHRIHTVRHHCFWTQLKTVLPAPENSFRMFSSSKSSF